MGNSRDFKVNDKVTLAGNGRVSGHIQSIDHLWIKVSWDGRESPEWYPVFTNTLIRLTGEDILDRVMKKYHGYGDASI